MQLKKLTALITVLSFVGQTFVLTGCVGNNSANDSSSQNNSANIDAKRTDVKSANLPSAELTDHRLWANLTDFDSSYIDYSKLDLAIDNNSNNDLEIVGCAYGDGASTESPTLLTITANSRAPRTKKFDSKWSAYADGGGGILDPKHITDNQIMTEGGPNGDTTTQCYYRVYHPEAGEFLYFKLKTQRVELATTGKSTLGQPDTDMQKIISSDVGQKLVNNEVSLKQITTAIPWSNQHDQQMSLINYADFEIKNHLQRSMDVFNQATMSIDTFQNRVYDPRDDYINYIRRAQLRRAKLTQNLMRDEFGVTDVPLDFLGRCKIYQTGNYRYIRVTDGFMGDRYKDYSPDNVDDFAEFRNRAKNKGAKLASAEEPRFRVQNTTEYYNDAVNQMGQYPQDPEDILSQMTAVDGEDMGLLNGNIPVNDEYMNLYSFDELISTNSEYASIEALVGDEALQGAADAAATTAEAMAERNLIAAIGGGAAAAGVIGMTIWGIVSMIQNNSKGAETDYKGNNSTKINMVTLEGLSDTDAALWNASHPNNPVEANTKASPINPEDENGGNNAVSQAVNLTFKDAKFDSQIGTRISLNSISTPWRRPGAQTEDPFLGKLQYNNSQTGTNGGNVGDAVVAMTISDMNNVSPIKDVSYAYNSAQMANLGLTSLAQDNRLPAPSYPVQQISNVNTNKLVYSAGMNGGLYGQSRGLLKVNGIEGLALNSGMKTTIGVQIPATGSKNSTTAYGLGFGSYLALDQDDRGLTPIKSDEFMLTGKDNESAMPYFYNKFNCSFPTKVGETCPLTMMVGGLEHKKYTGKLFIADGASKTTPIAIYINYNLVSDSTSSPLYEEGNLPNSITLDLKNFSGSDYKQINVSGLPQGASVDTNAGTCGVGLASGQECKLVLDISQVTDSATMIVYGNDGVHTDVPSADSADAIQYTLNVEGGA